MFFSQLFITFFIHPKMKPLIFLTAFAVEPITNFLFSTHSINLLLFLTASQRFCVVPVISRPQITNQPHPQTHTKIPKFMRLISAGQNIF